jgi:hypothetical protein
MRPMMEGTGAADVLASERIAARCAGGFLPAFSFRACCEPRTVPAPSPTVADQAHENANADRNRERDERAMLDLLGKPAQCIVPELGRFIAQLHCLVSHGIGAAGKPVGMLSRAQVPAPPVQPLRDLSRWFKQRENLLAAEMFRRSEHFWRSEDFGAECVAGKTRTRRCRNDSAAHGPTKDQVRKHLEDWCAAVARGTYPSNHRPRRRPGLLIGCNPRGTCVGMATRIGAGIGLGILLETLDKYRQNTGSVLRASHNRRPGRGYHPASHDRTLPRGRG